MGKLFPCPARSDLLVFVPVPRPQNILAALLAGLLLVCSLLAPAAAWHQALHSDCQSHPDTCLLCLLGHGKLDQPAPTQVWVHWCPAPAVALPVASLTSPTASAHRQPPGRAPPLGVASTEG